MLTAYMVRVDVPREREKLFKAGKLTTAEYDFANQQDADDIQKAIWRSLKQIAKDFGTTIRLDP